MSKNCECNKKSINQFEFELLDDVVLGQSGEEGAVIARAEYYNSENMYLVRYASADGRLVEQWWAESVLFINN